MMDYCQVIGGMLYVNSSVLSYYCGFIKILQHLHSMVTVMLCFYLEYNNVGFLRDLEEMQILHYRFFNIPISIVENVRILST